MLAGLLAVTVACAAVCAAACAAGERGPAAEPSRTLPSTGRPAGVAAPQDDQTRSAPASPGEPDRGGIVSVAVPVGASGYFRGRSAAIVRAPIDRVRAVVLGFARYPEFMPHYEKCRVLGRTPGGGSDVYMEVSALHGAMKMWARVEMPKPIFIEGVETYASRMLAGNVHDLQAIWRLETIDAQQTRLSLEVFLKPKLPLPKSLVNAENLEGSASAIAAMRARIEEGEIATR
jgi:ribosome-associated toxin RatA of RatAB toxin-antitoxin module